VEGTSCCDEHASDVVSRNHMPEPVVGRPDRTQESFWQRRYQTQSSLSLSRKQHVVNVLYQTCDVRKHSRRTSHRQILSLRRHPVRILIIRSIVIARFCFAASESKNPDCSLPLHPQALYTPSRHLLHHLSDLQSTQKVFQSSPCLRLGATSDPHSWQRWLTPLLSSEKFHIPRNCTSRLCSQPWIPITATTRFRTRETSFMTVR